MGYVHEGMASRNPHHLLYTVVSFLPWADRFSTLRLHCATSFHTILVITLYIMIVIVRDISVGFYDHIILKLAKRA